MSGNIVLAMVIFIVFSVVVGQAMASAGGWRALADRFPVIRSPPLDEVRYRFVTMRISGGRVGTAAYKNCATVGVSERGISLELWAPFRLFHPPMFIPWEAVERWRIVDLYPKRLHMTVKGGGSLTITGRAMEAISSHAAQRGVVEEIG